MNIPNIPPAMPISVFSLFKEHVARSHCYLEYGCGGSTVYAACTAKVDVIISVESDKIWAEKIKKCLDDLNLKLYIEHCDIGEVIAWGTPKSNHKINDYWKYMVTPWHVAKKHGFIPDTILIDGRFRVASFLYSLLSAREGTTILFDDYTIRPEYHVIEDFCTLRDTRGYMGVFSVLHDYSVAEICEKIAQYSIQSK